MEKYPQAGKSLKQLEEGDGCKNGEGRGEEEGGRWGSVGSGENGRGRSRNGMGEEEEEEGEDGEEEEGDDDENVNEEKSETHDKVVEGEDGEEEEEAKEEEKEEEEEGTQPHSGNAPKKVIVKFGIDATKLTLAQFFGRRKPSKTNRAPGFTKIIFNFPHVGGKTKDINRQVRFNQGHYSPPFPPLTSPRFPSFPHPPFYLSFSKTNKSKQTS